MTAYPHKSSIGRSRGDLSGWAASRRTRVRLVSVPEFLLLVAAGIGGGLSGSIAGLASLFSYPALLAVGLPPLTANVTNTVALVFSSAGSVTGSLPELRGQSRTRLRNLCLAGITGGVVGSVLLISTPPDTFERVVPVLIALASLGVLLPRRRVGDTAAAGDPRWLPLAMFGISIYGGYFGAAAGVLMLAILLLSTSDTLAACNATKNLILGVANGVAAIFFVIASDVRWTAVLPLALGLFIGARTGPAVVRRAPARPLRLIIAVAGLGLAIRLGLQAY
jgi:uncharacterized membrane protein YfcA